MFSRELKIWGPWIAMVVLGAAAFGANVIISPNMGMPVPVVGSEPGPDWANDINASLSIIDSHDHSPGRGVQVTPAGLNISSDLPFISHNATQLRSARFTAQGSPLALPSDLGVLYVSGVDLYYNDESGNQVRITQGGNVTGATGTITGLPSGTASASFAASTFTFQSATNTPAILNVGPLVIGTNTVSPKTVTLAPPGGLAANYNLTLFNGLPGSTSLVTLDSSGNLVASNSSTTPSFTTLALGSGSAAVPSLTFTGDTDTGIYQIGANKIDFTTNGVYRAEISAGNADFSGTAFVGFPTGTIPAPGLAFASDAQTGITQTVPGELVISTAGAQRVSFTAAAAEFSGTSQILAGSGSAASPAFSFASDTNTGFYRGGADVIGITIGGTSVGSINSGGISMSTPISTSGKLTATGTCTIRTTTANLVTCSAGEIVTGGGCRHAGGITDSYPLSANQWACGGGGPDLGSYAICCTI